ncbi:MAG: hypothetical protein DRI24_13690 [Deltaproteobacteria bacterium]|nr:MAG: hypothetical protein DRI24_13690 [Deltaproteobacteria bacterium]
MRNKKKVCLIFGFAIIFMSGLLFPVSYGSAEEDKKMLFKRPLKFASWFSPKHWFPPYEKELIKKLEDASDGQIKIQFFGAQSLGKILEQYEMVMDGVSDISGSVPVAYESDKLPLTSLVEYPFVWKSAEVGTKVFWELYDAGYFKNEYKDFKLIAYWSCAVNQLYTTKKRIDKIENFKGMKLFAGSPVMFAAFKQLGSIPIKMGYPDVYTALQRGTLDGSMGNFFATSHGLRWPEQCKYAWKCDIKGGFGLVLGVNNDVWNKIPADIQDKWEKVGREMSFKFAKVHDEKTELGKAAWEKAGREVIEIPKEEIDKMAEKFLPVWQKWIDDNEAKGRPAKEVYKTYVKIMKEMGRPVIMKLPGLYEN